MPRYLCTKPCWYGNHLYRLGEVAEFAKGEYPRHQDGTLAHFQQIDGRKKEPIPADEEDTEVTVRVNQKERK